MASVNAGPILFNFEREAFKNFYFLVPAYFLYRFCHLLAVQTLPTYPSPPFSPHRCFPMKQTRTRRRLVFLNTSPRYARFCFSNKKIPRIQSDCTNKMLIKNTFYLKRVCSTYKPQGNNLGMVTDVIHIFFCRTLL